MARCKAVQVSMDEWTVAALDSLAWRDGISRSELVRALVKEAWEDRDQQLDGHEPPGAKEMLYGE